jgi:hypothetical protein
MAAAGLGFAAAPALAQTVPQSAPPATSNTPATQAVGPRDLQNFSLGGTVTRQADPVAPPSSAPARRAAPPATASDAPARTETPRSARPMRPDRASAQTPPAAARIDAPRETAPSLATTTRDVSPPPAPAPQALATAPLPSFAPPTVQPIALSPEARFVLWPWLLAALALAAGVLFLFWRSRRQGAFAGGPQLDAFVAPEAAPRPVPRPAPAPAPAPPVASPAPQPQPSFPGLVTTRLRPTLEIAVNPLRFVVEDARVALELEIELFNSGSAPARGVLVEATLVNAGNQQDEQLGAFFADPVGQGERIVVIGPLQRVMIKSQVAVTREEIQQFEIAGKKVCVPLLALNALYGWNNKEGQTSVAYLIGRETEGGKLAPIRLDLGPRLFRGIGLRQLPNELRK